jgi:hypothetical protein
VPWFDVDDGFNDRPELLRIPARFRNAAIGVWTQIGVWMSKSGELFIPDDMIKSRCGGTETLIRHLAESGLLLRETEDDSRGLAYTGRGCRVRAPEEVRKRREMNAERVRNHRRNKSKRPDQDEPEDVTRYTSERNEPDGIPSIPNPSIPNQVETKGEPNVSSPPRPSMLLPGNDRRPDPAPPDPQAGVSAGGHGRTAGRLVKQHMSAQHQSVPANRTAMGQAIQVLLGQGEPEEECARFIRFWNTETPHRPLKFWQDSVAAFNKQRNSPGRTTAKVSGWLNSGKESDERN